MIKYKKRIGEETINTHGTKVTILEYISCKNVVIIFDNGHIKNVSYDNFKSGFIVSPYCKTVIKIGFIGVVIATLISLSLSSMWFTYMFHKHLNYSIFDLIRKIVFTPFVISIFAGIIVLGLNYYINSLNIPLNRLLSFCLLFLDTVIFITIYLLITLKTNYFDKYDKDLLRLKIINILR